MATSKKLNGTKLSDQTLSAVATRVSLSVRQENGEVTKTRVTCGRGFDTPLANYDPGTQSWKMCADISLWEELTYLATLPPSGMTRNGVLYQQPAWEPITSETASSSWPTPIASAGMAEEITTVKARLDNGTAYKHRLVEAVSLWPTPTTMDHLPPRSEEALERQQTNNRPGRTTPPTLKDAAAYPERWPTPTHGKLAGGSGAFRKVADLYSDGTISDEERKAMQAGNGGKLNPTWVEWLMGFPTGWTDLKDSETL